MAEPGFHWPSLVVYLVNFTILLAVLYKFAYKRILNMLDLRSQKIADSLAEAEAVRQESSDARNQLEEQLAANRQEVQQMIEQARQVAETERQQIAEQARQEADSLLARAKTEREQATEVAMQEVRQHFSELAITAAEKILQGSIDKNKHSELIENVLIEANEKQ